jgi:broad specificity phosphatase PhoE
MTLRLTLVCHASTPALREGRFADDEALDDIGRRDAAAMATAMPRADRVWTSPSRAAKETAQLLGLTGEEEPLLRECDFGRWRGRGLEDLHAAEADALALWGTDAFAAPHGGESFVDLLARADQWLRTRAGAEGRELVIGDPLILRAVIVCALGGTVAMMWHLDFAPLAFVRLSRSADRWHLRFDKSD